MHRAGNGLLAVATLTLLQACAEDKGDSGLAEPASARPAQTGAPSPPSGRDAMSVDAQIEAARQHLARSQGVELSRIGVERALAVTWSSGALGCPEPGMNYTMALVPGVLIRLTADDETYSYHAGTGGAPFFCPPERAEPPAMGTGEDLM